MPEVLAEIGARFPDPGSGTRGGVLGQVERDPNTLPEITGALGNLLTGVGKGYGSLSLQDLLTLDSMLSFNRSEDVLRKGPWAEAYWNLWRRMLPEGTAQDVGYRAANQILGRADLLKDYRAIEDQTRIPDRSPVDDWGHRRLHRRW